MKSKKLKGLLVFKTKECRRNSGQSTRKEVIPYITGLTKVPKDRSITQLTLKP